MTVRGPRRPLVAVVGDARLSDDDVRAVLARTLGRALVDRGARVLTGGLGGVMEEALRGACESAAYTEGSTVAVLPGSDPQAANPWADIVIASGLDLARNLVVANSDGIVAIGGGAGTLMELASAWQLRRPIVALGAEGWAGRLAGEAIDGRRRQVELPDDQIHAADTPELAAELVLTLIPRHPERHKGVIQVRR